MNIPPILNTYSIRVLTYIQYCIEVLVYHYNVRHDTLDQGTLYILHHVILPGKHIYTVQVVVVLSGTLHVQVGVVHEARASNHLSEDELHQESNSQHRHTDCKIDSNLENKHVCINYLIVHVCVHVHLCVYKVINERLPYIIPTAQHTLI